MFTAVRKEIPEKGVTGFHLLYAGAARIITAVTVLATILSFPCFTEERPEAEKFSPPVLKQAVLCEKIEKSKPVHEGVVFSAGIERLFCFTYFEPVYIESHIFHKYYFKDEVISKTRLSIKPPSFATYSRIELRESDKGPWRVEITDADDNVLTSIRFSITD